MIEIKYNTTNSPTQLHVSRKNLIFIPYEINLANFHQHKLESILSIFTHFLRFFLPLTVTTNDGDDHDDNYSEDFRAQLHLVSCTIRIFSQYDAEPRGLATLDHRLSFASDASLIRYQIIRAFLAFKVVYIYVGIS